MARNKLKTNEIYLSFLQKKKIVLYIIYSYINKYICIYLTFVLIKKV